MSRRIRTALTVLVAGLMLAALTGAAAAQGSRVRLAGAAPAGGRHVQAARPDLASSDWLGEINRYRAATGLTAVTDQPAWDVGIAHHLTYLVKTPSQYRTGQYASAHTENPASPYYTADGAQEGAASDLVLGGATTPLHAIDGWWAAPFHAIGMLRPALRQVALAVDASTGYAGLDVISGLDPIAPAPTAPVLFPGPGVTTNLTIFGGESPDPTQTCGWQKLSVGLPLVVLLTQPPPTAIEGSLTGPGESESTAKGTLCVVDANTYHSTDPVYGPTGLNILQGADAVLLIPRHPLVGGANSARLSVPGQPTIAWSFTVNSGVVSAGKVTLHVPGHAPAHHAFKITVSCPKACSVTLTVTSRAGRVLYRFAGGLKAGQRSFTVRVARAQSTRGRRVGVTLRFSGAGHGTRHANLTFR